MIKSDMLQMPLPFEADERWLEVVRFEGLYLVSDLARIRSLPRQTARGVLGARRDGRDILGYTLGSNGYPRVKLSRDGVSRRYLLHHIVTDAFLGPLPPGLVRRHKNGIKTDCRLVNLEFGTASENVQDSLRLGLIDYAKGDEHCRAKLTEVKVREIRSRYAAGSVTMRSLADEYGVGHSVISTIIARKAWKHVA